MKYLYINHPVFLENGATLPSLRLAYHTYGKLNAARDNVIWVCHALTANSDAEDWWPGLVGKGFTIDPERYFIVCVNMVGSCYGSTGPMDINPATGQAYGLDFPLVTTRDFARILNLTANYLGLQKIRLLIGGSMGGQHALEWASLYPDRFDLLCVLATNARHSAWGIAFNEAQRMALRADPTLGTEAPEAGRAGLEAARAVAMLSYRHYRTYVNSQTGKNSEEPEDFRASSYQRYQGNKLWKRFEPTAYYALGRGMDSHDLGRDQKGDSDEDRIAKALARITATSLVIGIDTDILFPLEEQGLISRHLPNSRFQVINADFGHDGFLTEAKQLGDLLADFLQDTLAIDGPNKHAFTEGLTGRKFALPGTESV
ncbi:homoserine O-acetyltransferase [Lewinellaceae bacterium SD302]|nr:homoserine O-acetyltransferase [Lewinellaceae bacterium SD302]